MRLAALLVSLASIVIAYPASAVFKHYGVHFTTISETNTATPSPNKYPPRKDGSTPVSVGIVDDTNNGSPLLKRLRLIQENETTSHVPGLSGFLFLSMFLEQGTRNGLITTGTGDTSSTIAWGVVTGWTLTGGFWCHSSPTFLCVYARGKDLATTEPAIHSPFYDLGTWTFHGTGFTSVPYVNQAGPGGDMSVGNVQHHVRGRLMSAIIPAVPVLGMTFLGASLLLAGARLLRRDLTKGI